MTHGPDNSVSLMGNLPAVPPVAGFAEHEGEGFPTAPRGLFDSYLIVAGRMYINGSLLDQHLRRIGTGYW